MLPIASVPCLWPEATVICVGTGPSLTLDDLQYIRGCSPRPRVVVINDAYGLARWADVLYAPDPRWWRWHGDAVRLSFPGLKYTLEHSADAEAAGAQRLNYRSGGGLSLDPTMVMTGGHGGFQAINLAVHLGARRIGLLGYDLQPDPSGVHHYFGDHPDGSHVPYAYWRDIYATLNEPCAARGLTIVNCSRRTAITAFPQRSLQEFLGDTSSTSQLCGR